MSTALQREAAYAGYCGEDFRGLRAIGTQPVLPEERYTLPTVLIGQKASVLCSELPCCHAALPVRSARVFDTLAAFSIEKPWPTSAPSYPTARSAVTNQARSTAPSPAAVTCPESSMSFA